METHVKIVELFGLPGCGKTTLVDSLFECGEKNNTNSYSSLHDLLIQYRQLPFWTKVNVIPIKTWIYVILFIFSVPRVPVKKWRLYSSFFYISFLYNYAKHIQEPLYILVDHGLIQSAQSLIYGHANTLSNKSWNLLLKIFQVLNVEFLVYCRIDSTVSLHRIRKRNRKGNGRLDMITDDNKLLNILNHQKLFFDSAYSIMSILKDTQTIEIDTNTPVENIAKSLASIIHSV